MKHEVDELKQSIGLFGECYSQPMTAHTVAAYVLVLSDVPLDAVQRAIGEFMAEDLEFRPTPGAIRHRALGTQSDAAKALVAWNELCEAVRIGPYKHVQFADPRITAALRLIWGRWSTVCDRFAEGEKEEKWIRLEFLKAYKICLRRPLTEDLVRPLSGLSEGEVVDGQIVAPVPRMLGKEPDDLAQIHYAPQPPLVALRS